MKSFEVWCVGRNESKLIKHFNLVPGFYPDDGVVSEWMNRSVQDAGFQGVIAEFTVETWMFSVAVVQIITLLHFCSDDAVINKILLFWRLWKSHRLSSWTLIWETDFTLTLWTWPDRYVCAVVFVGRANTQQLQSSCDSCCFFAFLFYFSVKLAFAQGSGLPHYSASSGNFVKQNPLLIPLKLLNFCWNNDKYSCCCALKLIQFIHISSSVYFPLKCQCGLVVRAASQTPDHLFNKKLAGLRWSGSLKLKWLSKRGRSSAGL